VGAVINAERGVDDGKRVGRAAAQRAPGQQRRHQRPGLAPVDQAGYDAPLRGELVGQRREPGTAGQRPGMKGTAPVGSGTRGFRPRFGRHPHHLLILHATT